MTPRPVLDWISHQCRAPSHRLEHRLERYDLVGRQELRSMCRPTSAVLFQRYEASTVALVRCGCVEERVVLK
ncbi:hypothetical protein NDU88_001749 [Pleurodeles waltl]|uniref:Uncharacterized protein n=1 Tax=Pleurodeles waltl TaxID=8319 RepID=A0AAV7M0I9_PLEWA|nr:hypothetical protein NDU88_001749 [Pleurodeles waltl]